MSSLPASIKKIRSKTTEKRWRHRFSHYKSMGAFCCHGNQSFDLICLKTLCSLSPTPVMLHIKFDLGWPAGFRDIQVWKCGRRQQTTDDGRRRTDDGPLLYYKLTLWAFGSCELKSRHVHQGRTRLLYTLHYYASSFLHVYLIRLRIRVLALVYLYQTRMCSETIGPLTGYLRWVPDILLIFLQLQLFMFNANFLTFHFVLINHIQGSENTFILLVFSASKDLSAVTLPTEDLPII